jgi:hypothetical protein
VSPPLAGIPQIVGRGCAPDPVTTTPPPLRPLRRVGHAYYESAKRSSPVRVMGRALSRHSTASGTIPAPHGQPLPDPHAPAELVRAM